MRILFAATGYLPATRIGGPVSSLSSLAEALTARGHEITVMCTNSNLDETVDVPIGIPVDVNGVDVRYFPFKNPCLLPAGSGGFMYSPLLRRALQRHVPDYDVVHTQLPFTYPTLTAIRAAARSNKPVVYHQHGVFSPERLRYRGLKKALYLALVERRNLAKAAVLIALTRAEETWYRNIGCMNRVEIVPNGVGLPALDALEPWHHREIPGQAPIVLFLSRLHPLKGPHCLVRAFTHVLKDIPDAHLVIAGPDEAGMEKELRRLALTISEHVHLIGMITGVEKSRLFKRAAVFCLPSVAEGFSMSVLEALAHGTPVVISAGCHFTEVESTGAGYVTGDDPCEIAGAITKVINDPAMTPYCAGARALVENGYKWDTIAERMEIIYRSVIR